MVLADIDDASVVCSGSRLWKRVYFSVSKQMSSSCKLPRRASSRYKREVQSYRTLRRTKLPTYLKFSLQNERLGPRQPEHRILDIYSSLKFGLSRILKKFTHQLLRLCSAGHCRLTVRKDSHSACQVRLASDSLLWQTSNSASMDRHAHSAKFPGEAGRKRHTLHTQAASNSPQVNLDLLDIFSPIQGFSPS